MPNRMLKGAVLLTAMALAVPAYAEEEGQGFNNGTVGIVVASDVYDITSPDDKSEKFAIGGDCDFEGVIVPVGQPGGGQIVRFTGTVTSAGPAVPIVTNITCEIFNAFGNYHSQDLQLNGNSATVVGSTLNDETTIWPLQPITVCTSGKAVYGPDPVREITLRRKCKTPS